MPVPTAAPAPLQRGLSPSPQTIQGSLLISALIQKLLKGWVLLSFDSGVGFGFLGFFCMQEFGFSIQTHTTALGTRITWQPPGTAPKPSSTPEYLFNNHNIIKGSLQNLGALQIFPVFLLKTELFCCGLTVQPLLCWI